MARKPTDRPETFKNSITGILREAANKNKEELAEKLLTMALSGDLGAIKYIYDRLEPVSQNIDVTVDGKMKAVIYLPKEKPLHTKRELPGINE